MKYALVLKGAISRTAAYGRYGDMSVSKTTEGFVDYKLCHESINKHVILANSNIDVFIQSWSLALEEEMVKLYKPVKYNFVDDSLFESQITEKHSTVGSRRSSTSICKSWELAVNMVKEYQTLRGIQYDKILVCRPDIYYKEDVILEEYDVSNGTMWTNCPGDALRDGVDGEGGDFHFIMNQDTFLKLGNIFKDISPNFIPDWHRNEWFYVKQILKQPTKFDKFFANVNIELIRNWEEELKKSRS